MSYTITNPEGEISEKQTWGFFKVTKKDYRTDIFSREINRGQFSDLMNTVRTFAINHNWDRAATQAEAERLLATFPARKKN